jgi:hypothetical protein
MPITSGKQRPFAFLPLTAATMLMIGVPLAIHGDAFERICGVASTASAVLLLTGWGLTMQSRAR